jgi:hypothetical protein
MKEGRIYNVLKEDNLEFMTRKTVRKKNAELQCVEEEMELYSEKFSKNWKTRRKKPPDKLIEVKLSLHLKLKYENRKVRKKSLGKKMRKKRREARISVIVFESMKQ